jgi:hypothetical protein
VPEDDPIRVPDAFWQRIRQYLPDAGDEPLVSVADLQKYVRPAFERLARAEAYRRSRPQREPRREARWRGLVRRQWKREIDDDEITLAGSRIGAVRDHALQLAHEYLDAFAQLGPGMPDAMPFVTAAVAAGVSKGVQLMEVLRFALRAERLQEELIAVVARASSLRATLESPRPAVPDWQVRAMAAERVHKVLTRGGRKCRKPSWKEKAGILWFHGHKINPRRLRDVDTLKADHFRWRRLWRARFANVVN